ncbi:hypothetical protein CPB85DRAFT_1331501 [Mucidula mucida]|nr:hypothetical protein CPB85DRAFT_1331501 [Mucidula mucida]
MGATTRYTRVILLSSLTLPSVSLHSTFIIYDELYGCLLRAILSYRDWKPGNLDWGADAASPLTSIPHCDFAWTRPFLRTPSTALIAHLGLVILAPEQVRAMEPLFFFSLWLLSLHGGAVTMACVTTESSMWIREHST